MRRLAVSLALAGCLAAPAAAAAQTRTDMSLTEVRSTGFPERAFVLTLPKRATLGPADVAVTENREPVGAVDVSPATAARPGDLGVVLAIDASSSMRGKAIRDAMTAARALAMHRDARQPLGILVFNGSSRMLTAPTTEPTAIDSALRRPVTLANGTHLYDAVRRSIAMLSDAGIEAGSVVVLSDGSDTGSSLDAAGAVALAGRAHVRVFTVGLRSRDFSPGALQALATGADGAYSEATSSGDLRRILTDLGAELSTGYLLRYRSEAGPEQLVRVRAHVPGFGTAKAGYVTPALELPPAPEPYRRAVGWASGGVVTAVSLTLGVLVAVALVLLLARTRERSLRTRVASFLRPDAEDRHGGAAARLGRLLSRIDRALDGRAWWTAFEELVDIARIEAPPLRMVAMAAAGSFAGAALLAAATGQPAALLLAVVAPFGVRAFVAGRAVRQRRLFAEQLADNLSVVASALRAGHSFIAALAVVVEDAPEPSRREFERVVADEQIGVPLETSLQEVVRRMDNSDLEQVALVAILQRQTGGNTAEVLDRVADTVRERQALRRLIISLTAQGRLSRWVLTALPILLLVTLTLVNPTYMGPLYHEPLGVALLVVAGVLLVSGSLVIKRIVEIEV